MKLLSLLLLLPLVCLGQGKYHSSKISGQTQKITKEVKKIRGIAYHDIYQKWPIVQESLLKDIYDTATTQELIELTNHPNGKVRCYAFGALAAKNKDTLFGIIKQHITDEEQVPFTVYHGRPGELASVRIITQMVGDFYIDFAVKTFAKEINLTNLQLHELDSLVLYAKTDLYYRTQVINTLQRNFDKKLLSPENTKVDDKAFSVISVEQANIVYRGVDNPIKIAVTGAQSFTAEANGVLKKKDSLGNYYWNVSSLMGSKGIIKINAIMPDGTIKNEEKEFQVRAIPAPRAYVTSDFEWLSYEMTRQQLKDLTLNSKMDELYFTLDSKYFTVREFEMLTKTDTIVINGNKMSPNAFEAIDNLQNGSEITLTGIVTWVDERGHGPRLGRIKIRIVDEPIPDDYIPHPVTFIKGYKTLYRGIENNLNITVPEAKSFKVTAPGLVKGGRINDYHINVSKIKENRVLVDYEIVTRSDSIVKYQDVYFIEDLKPLVALINGQGCEKCIVQLNKSDFENAKISIRKPLLVSPFDTVYVRSYIIEFPNGKNYEIEGDVITAKILEQIKELPKGSFIRIRDIDFYFPCADILYPLTNINITLTD